VPDSPPDWVDVCPRLYYSVGFPPISFFFFPTPLPTSPGSHQLLGLLSIDHRCLLHPPSLHCMGTYNGMFSWARPAYLLPPPVSPSIFPLEVFVRGHFPLNILQVFPQVPPDFFFVSCPQLRSMADSNLHFQPQPPPASNLSS